MTHTQIVGVNFIIAKKKNYSIELSSFFAELIRNMTLRNLSTTRLCVLKSEENKNFVWNFQCLANALKYFI